MSKTAAEIAQVTGGKLIGPADFVVENVAEIDQAGLHDLAFAFEKEHLLKALSSNAGAFIVTSEIPSLKKTQIIVQNGRLAMAQAISLLKPLLHSDKEEIHASAVVHSSVQKGKSCSINAYAVLEKNVVLGNNVYIGAHVYIGENVSIGDDSVIYPNVSIYPETKIGKRVRINCGSAVGVDGFGFVQHEGQNIKVPQVGCTILEDDVELCGLNTIARATIGETRIGAGTKIDSMVHIGHNVKIGKNCILVASAAVAGNATLGNNVIIAGKAGVSDHVSIGDNSVVMANSVVTKDFPAKSVLLGFPAKEYRAEQKNQANLNRLSSWFDRIKELEKKILGAK